MRGNGKSNRGRLDGYKGTERFIDLNVFGGTKEEWNAYGRDETMNRIVSKSPLTLPYVVACKWVLSLIYAAFS